MSANRRKPPMRLHAPSQPATTSCTLSGAEMLVLQQSIKQYIIARQSRLLTPHELQEFAKLKEQLLPSLLRYSQSRASLLTANSSENGNGDTTQRELSVSLPSCKGAASSNDRHEIYPIPPPTLRPNVQPQSGASSSRNSIKAKPATVKSRRTAVKTKPPADTISLNLTQLDPRSSTAGRGAVANTGKKAGSRKRPKMEVYQDAENPQQKKKARVRKSKDNVEDPDKENRDPLGAAPSEPKKRALGDSTNLTKSNINNITATQSELKGKAVVRDSIVEKSNTKTTTKSTTAQPKSTRGSKARQVPGARTTHAHATTTAVKDLPADSPAHLPARPLIVQQTHKIIDDSCVATQEPVGIIAKTTEKDFSQDTNKNVDESFFEEGVGYQRQTRGKGKNAVIEIMPSVEDDGSVISFEPYIKVQGGTSPANQKRAAECEEVPDSELSNDMYGNNEGDEEATLPAPEFLIESAPDDTHDAAPQECGGTHKWQQEESLLGNSIEDELGEEATLPMPEFLLYDALEEQQEAEKIQEDLEATTGPKAATLSDFVGEDDDDHLASMPESADITAVLSVNPSQDVGTAESTGFSDGVWCIDDYKHGVVSTVCGHSEQWIAIETNSHVQFWLLINQGALPDSKWCRRVQLNKSSAHPIQILFAPDDSFAVLLNAMDRSIMKVTLEDLRDPCGPEIAHSRYLLTGATLSSKCEGFISKVDNTYTLTCGADEPGAICLTSIPESEVSTETSLLSEKVSYLGTNEYASSVCLVRNTTSLTLVSFGTALVLWDLKYCYRPVSIADASIAFSPFPSPLPSSPLLTPIIMSATVPAKFFNEYQEMLGRNELPVSEWPLLLVLKMCDTEVDDSEQSDADRCALYVMKGGGIELVHTYEGSRSISYVSASSRFVACQTKAHGKDNLCLWDILKPQAVAQLSLTGSPSHQDLVAQKIKTESDDCIYVKHESQEERRPLRDETDDIFSSISTLSSPPGLSTLSLQSLSEDGSLGRHNHEGKRQDASKPSIMDPTHAIDHLADHGSFPRRPRAVACAPLTRRPTEWIDLTSVSWMDRKRVQFSLQEDQHWVTIVQQDMSRRNPSVVHIMDLTSILSNTCL
ncbi:hypothetical protein EDD11_009687 [Mortierella claussenii]|nr:hypothetical protein EDD11_009687 [Mortierella claussenii]